MKFYLKKEILPLFIIAVAFVLGFYFYSIFPEQVPVHWNVAGEVDRWGSKFEGAFLMPLIGLGMYLLFWLIPLIDPKKEKYLEFEKVYHIFRNLIILVLFGIYLIASLNGLGKNIRVEVWIPLMIGVLFLILGNYMSKIKPNWFMGIRTPWTMSSEEVWNKTHRLGGKTFMLMGLWLIITPILPFNSLVWILIVPIGLMAVIPIVYSYILFKREKK